MKRNKTAVIDISDDESKSSVKKREEPSLSQEVVELKQKLAKSEKDKLGAIRIAGEAQARVELLENLIDKKRVSQQDERDGGDKKLVKELQKKIEELTKENEMARRKANLTDGREETIAAVHLRAVEKEEEEKEANDDGIQSLNGVSMVPNFTHQLLIEPKEELKEDREEEMLDDYMNGSEHSIEKEEGGRSKNIPKKRKSTKRRSGWAKKRRQGGLNTTELKCPECEYRTRSAGAWYSHLAHSHSTTTTIAGVVLLCDCGKQTRTVKHFYECDVANFTIIAMTYEKITTPQCILCEKFPKTICGYIYHLQRHNTSLKENNIYLKCSCGFEYYSYYTKKLTEAHKECDSCQFTLHKLEEK